MNDVDQDVILGTTLFLNGDDAAYLAYLDEMATDVARLVDAYNGAIGLTCGYLLSIAKKLQVDVNEAIAMLVDEIEGVRSKRDVD